MYCSFTSALDPGEGLILLRQVFLLSFITPVRYDLNSYYEDFTENIPATGKDERIKIMLNSEITENYEF